MQVSVVSGKASGVKLVANQSAVAKMEASALLLGNYLKIFFLIQINPN